MRQLFNIAHLKNSEWIYEVAAPRTQPMESYMGRHVDACDAGRPHVSRCRV